MTAADRPGGRDDIDARFAEIISGYDLDWDEQRPVQDRPAAATPEPEATAAPIGGPETPTGVPVRETGLDPLDFEPMRLLDPSVFGPGSPSAADLDDAAGQAARDRHRENPQTEREWRRAQRKLEREIELEAFNSEKERLDREYRNDPEGWTPPPPPPVPKPHRRTVVALILILIGGLVMLRPNWFSVPHDVSLILGLLAAVGGVWLLVQNLRRRHTDPIESTWDDGAEL